MSCRFDGFIALQVGQKDVEHRKKIAFCNKLD
jgi:hypothetical protein